MNNKTLHIRASAADRAWDCTESLLPGDGPLVSPTGEAAELGSAFHEWARTRNNGAKLEEIVTRYGVDAEDLDRLVAYAMIAERDLRKWFVGATAEKSMEHREPWDCPPYTEIHLTGTVDRAEVVNDRGAILDYKTGRIETGYEHQQRTYAFLWLCANPKINEVQSATVHVAHGYWRGRTYSSKTLWAWWYDLLRRLANGVGRFSPGDHCSYCPRRPTCPGVEAYHRSALATVVGDDAEASLHQLTADNKELLGPDVADKRRRVAYIQKRCEEFMAVLRNTAEEIGPIPAGDGKVLRIVPQHRQSLDTLRAWGILSATIGEAALAEACVIKLSRCKQFVRDAAPTGSKGQAATELLADLVNAGAVSETIVKQLREVAK
ncbi:MAG: PD-(D/E)XK nuclease family protein [Nitrospiraceae bacterium]